MDKPKKKDEIFVGHFRSEEESRQEGYNQSYDEWEAYHKSSLKEVVEAILRICQYQTSSQLRRGARKDYGLDYEEALEMAYDNIRNEAKRVKKLAERIKE